MKIKEPVRLRQKKLANGNVSLYLDIYHEGVRRYEFLKLYLVEEKTRQDKETNKNTLLLANSIKAKYILDVQSGAYDVKLKKENSKNFFDYFDKLASDKPSRYNWKSIKPVIVEFNKGDNLPFKRITASYVAELRKHIAKLDIKEGTKHLYFSVAKCALNNAIKDGLINQDVLLNVQGFKPSEAKRVYLTADEVKKMVQTECRHQRTKEAFLFSCLTGLRISDTLALKWGDVTSEYGYTRITFKQKKTHWQEYLDINEQAVQMMGARGQDDEPVFAIEHGRTYIWRVIKQWAVDAGINKNISFHTARHSFATMMLANHVDIYTVSKLVGHRDISTTQIYAKIMDEDKRKAVDKLPDILS